MNNLTLSVIAACCAAAMVVLVKTGANRDLRAALRTTIVLLVGWSCAWSAHPVHSWNALSKRTWVLAVLSSLAIAASWTMVIRRARHLADEDNPTIDQVNVGFAILFAVTLFGGRPLSEFWPSSALIIMGALVLARRR